MKYAIISIGDELLIGQVTDTNSGWIAREMTAYGWELQQVQVVADDAQAIKKAIDNKRPALIECIIDPDDKVFPMVPAGKPIAEVFDASDLTEE